MRNRLIFFAYRLLSRFAEILPGSCVRPLSSTLAPIAMRLNSGQRAVVASNLQRVRGCQPTASQVRAAYASYIRYWLEAFRLPVLTTDRLDQLFSIEGLEHIERGRERGHGVVVALPHVGNWDMAAAWIAHHGFPLTVVVEQLEPPELFTWFKDFRTSLGVNVVVNGPHVANELLSALAGNQVVALMSDRDVDGTGTLREFFGEMTKLPRGPAILAARSGAVLIPGAIYEDGDGYRAVLESPISTERRGRLADDVDRISSDLTGCLERLIRRAPEQWHVFQPNWPDDHRLAAGS